MMAAELQKSKMEALVSMATSDDDASECAIGNFVPGIVVRNVLKNDGLQKRELALPGTSYTTSEDGGPGTSQYDWRDVNIAREKNVVPVSAPHPLAMENVMAMRKLDVENAPNIEGTVDINKRQAMGKVELPEQEDSWTTFIPGSHISVRPKAPMKRILAQQHTSVEQDFGIGLSMKKQTCDLIAKINQQVASGKPSVKQSMETLNYDKRAFSGIENLKSSPNVASSSGSFGDVFKVYDINTSRKMVLKKVKGKIERNEVIVPLECRGAPNLAQVFGLGWDGVHAYIIQEDAGLSLRSLIDNPKFCSKLGQPGFLEKIILDLFSGLETMAKYKIGHLDVKPENACMDIESGRVRLVDFGSSKTAQDSMTYIGLTPEYLPPNVSEFLSTCYRTKQVPHLRPRLTEKDDVWAGGMVALFLLHRGHFIIKHFTGSSDYPKDSAEIHEQTRKHVLSQAANLKDPMPGIFISWPGSETMEGLLKMTLVVDADKRCTAKAVVEYLKDKLNNEDQPKRKVPKLNIIQPPILDVDEKEQSPGVVDIKQAKGHLQPRSDKGQAGSAVTFTSGSPLGVSLKPAAVAFGGILLPAKQLKGSGFPASPAPLPPGQGKPAESVWGQQSGDDDYNLLVKSFTPGAMTNQQPASQPTIHRMQQWRQTSSQRSETWQIAPSSSGQQNRAGQVYNFTQHQQQQPNIIFCQGLTGTVFKFVGNKSEKFEKRQEMQGNVPDMNALMSDGYDSTMFSGGGDKDNQQQHG